ncbi:MAG: helix-turn-helix domain-containing protein [Limisphaerales bacterium]
MKSDSEYVKPKWIAEYFDVCENTVRNWAEAGYIQKHFLPSVGRGKQENIRFLRADVPKLARKQPWNKPEDIQA